MNVCPIKGSGAIIEHHCTSHDWQVAWYCNDSLLDCYWKLNVFVTHPSTLLYKEFNTRMQLNATIYYWGTHFTGHRNKIWQQTAFSVSHAQCPILGLLPFWSQSVSLYCSHSKNTAMDNPVLYNMRMLWKNQEDFPYNQGIFGFIERCFSFSVVWA